MDSPDDRRKQLQRYKKRLQSISIEPTCANVGAVFKLFSADEIDEIASLDEAGHGGFRHRLDDRCVLDIIRIKVTLCAHGGKE